MSLLLPYKTSNLSKYYLSGPNRGNKIYLYFKIYVNLKRSMIRTSKLLPDKSYPHRDRQKGGHSQILAHCSISIPITKPHCYNLSHPLELSNIVVHSSGVSKFLIRDALSIQLFCLQRWNGVTSKLLAIFIFIFNVLHMKKKNQVMQ